MRADKRALIKRACGEIASQALLIEREVEGTGEIQALVEQIYSAADEISELSEEQSTSE